MPEPFTPTSPMLCRYWFVEKLFKKADEVGCEIKYNGIRAMVHKKGDEVKIFTRHLNDITGSFQHLIPGLQEAITGDAIIDCELISDRFYDIISAIKGKKKIKAKLMAFDIIYNGDDLCRLSLSDRRLILKNTIKPNKVICILDQHICYKLDEVKAFYRKALDNGEEGIVVKLLDSKYIMGERPYSWIKAKRRRD
jgi:DNA ligase-1